MPTEQEDLIRQLEEIENKEDINGLNALVESLSAVEIQQYQAELTAAYEGLYSVWYYDLVCNKIIEEDRERFVGSLLEVITFAGKVNPEKSYYAERAECYKFLSGIKTDPTEKLIEIQKAIDEYAGVLKDKMPVEICALMVNALLDRMLITSVFTDDEFRKILTFFQHALAQYSETAVSSLLHACFRILNFPFPEKSYWHSQFIHTFNIALSSFAETTSIIALTWSNELVRVLEYQQYEITQEYADELNEKSIQLLEPLSDYQTDNINLLNQLGTSFKRAAKRTKTGQLSYYEIALRYFTKGQTLNPAAWTFPVYATSIIEAMAVIYHRQEDAAKVISLFETGRTLFQKVHEHEKDFTLNLNWGNFLIEYARLGYNFKSPDILDEAMLKLDIAKELGKNYYSQPYMSLARIALKTGDRDKCLDILRDCKAIFSTEYYEYDFGPFLRDDDFKEIWEEITSWLNTNPDINVVNK